MPYLSEMLESFFENAALIGLESLIYHHEKKLGFDLLYLLVISQCTTQNFHQNLWNKTNEDIHGD